MSLYFDNTRVEAAKKCLRKYYFRHVRHWRKEGTAIPLAFGEGWHRGMDILWQEPTYPDIVDKAMMAWESAYLEYDVDFRSPAFALQEMRNEGTARDMFNNYITQNKEFLSNIDLLHVEQPFVVPLYTGGDVFYVGRWDKVFNMKKGTYIVDHKTTSLYAKNGFFRQYWVSGFANNAQIDGYAYAAYMAFDEKFAGVWIDGALVHKTVHNGFMFIPLSKSILSTEAWLNDTRWWIQRIIDEQVRYEGREPETLGNVLKTFPKNTGSCMEFGQVCPYFDICRFVPNPETLRTVPEDFVVDKWEPFDELKLDTIGLKK